MVRICRSHANSVAAGIEMFGVLETCVGGYMKLKGMWFTGIQMESGQKVA